MKPVKILKSKNDVNLTTLLTLLVRCIIFIFFIAMIGCFLGRVIVFLKVNVLLFDWKNDVFYSLRVGFSAGTLAGIGIWIKAKLQERKDKNTSIK